MTNSVIVILGLLLASSCHQAPKLLVAALTSTSSPSTSIEDPNNSATTSESETTDDEAICLRCYDHVKMAQGLIANHESLVKQQKELIRNPKQPLISNHAAGVNQRRTKPRQVSAAPRNVTQIVGRNRTLADLLESNPIVVSRLRVARSPNRLESVQSNGLTAARNVERSFDQVTTDSDNQLRITKDKALKSLKHKQEQQFNKTCKSLYEVQKCLSEISRECLGNLQFHSHEVFLRQWLNKLNCPPAHNPSFKPYAALIRSITKVEEPEKVPISRPISSPEETRKRLVERMGPLGVMLKPTLTRTATQRFNSINQGGTVTEGINEPRPTRGRHILTTGSIIEYEPKQPIDNQIAIGQILLIPCFFVILVAFLTLTSRFLKQLRDD